MSSEIDPAKLKVVDLRQELSNRGLDTKGNKAVLVKRLKDALEKELKQDIPDTSIADTSTEDFDTSQTEPKSPDTSQTEHSVSPKKKELSEPPKDKPKETEQSNKSPKKKEPCEPSKEKPKVPVTRPEPAAKVETVSPQKANESKTEKVAEAKPELKVENVCVLPSKPKAKLEENGDHVIVEEKEDVEKPARKSRWTEEDKQEGDKQEDDKPSDDTVEEKEKQVEGEDKEKQSEDVEMQEDGDHKGEKRKRDSTSPGRSQRRRSRSPIKEDEPTIDSDKVQLSWYDSDLHLQLDKESFLSGKPLNEGAFGYIWAGARASHGVSSGKVCYEVKLTEELKFEDFNRGRNDRDRERYRTDHRRDDKGRDRRERRDSDRSGKKSHDKKSEKKDDKDKTEDKDDTKEKQEGDGSAEKMETDEDTNEEKSAGDSEKPSEDAENSTEKSEKVKETPSEDDQPEATEVIEEGKTLTKDVEDSQDTKPDAEDKTEKSEEDKEKQKDELEKMDTDESKPEETKPEEPPTEPIPERMFRVGFSLLNTGLQLGEEKHSFAYESSGKFATNKEFKDFGVTFGVGDVVGAFLSIDSEEVTFRFSVNGALQPETITVPRSEFPEENFVLFPHVLSRNYSFEINFGNKEEPWFPIPEELVDYQFLDKVEEKVAGPVRPEARSECEAILMIGLPSSGKTHWVNEHISANPEKKYTIIGNTEMLNRMTVSGEPLKSRFKGRWFFLMDRMQFCLNKLTDIASLRRRNYILDRPHVFPSQQRRKLRQFEGFKRHAVVVVVADEEQARREALVEDKSTKGDAVLDMKATFGIPSKEDDSLHEITFAGADEEEVKEIIKKYNEVGKAAGFGSRKAFQRRNYPNQPNYRDRGYQRYDRRPPPPAPSWGRQGPDARGWNRDRRDNRGPPPDRNWGRNARGGNRPPDRTRDAPRAQGASGGFNRNRPSGASGGGSGRQGGGSWGGGWGGQGGWQQQGYGNYGQGQSNWSGQGGQGSGQGQNWKYGGQGQGGYGGGYGGNWNYYNQYSQAGQNWNQGQTAGSTASASSGGAGGGQQNYANYTQQAWAQFARQYAQQQQAKQADPQKAQEKRK